jgi:hypothetical protein
MKEACAKGSVSYATRFNPGRSSFIKAAGQGSATGNKGVITIRRWYRSASPHVSIALAALFVFTVAMPGCSTRNDSLPALGTEEDYLARRENTTYPYGYAPYDLCTVYDPYCFAPYWNSAPIYYLSRRDGDHDRDDDSRRGPEKGFHHELPMRPTHGSSATAAPARSAHFGPLFMTGGFRGHGRR